MTKLGYFETNFFKNHKIFIEKCLRNEKLRKELFFHYFEYRIVKEKIGDAFDTRTFKNHKLAHEHGTRLMTKILEEEDYGFIEWFSGFLKESGLGENWHIPLMNFIACGYYCPPKEINIVISKNEDGNEVVLRLSPDTSRNDLIKSWPLISDKLNELKRKKRMRIPKTFFRDLDEQDKANAIGKKQFCDYGNIGDREEMEKDTDLLYKIYDENPEMLEKIEQNEKAYVNNFRVKKHRLKALH